MCSRDWARGRGRAGAHHALIAPFSQAILAGKRITEFRKDDGTELQRDFTYISDIVDGVIAASRFAAPLDIFNLGNTRPEKAPPR